LNSLQLSLRLDGSGKVSGRCTLEKGYNRVEEGVGGSRSSLSDSETRSEQNGMLYWPSREDCRQFLLSLSSGPPTALLHTFTTLQLSSILTRKVSPKTDMTIPTLPEDVLEIILDFVHDKTASQTRKLTRLHFPKLSACNLTNTLSR